jgi:hypothetical protein
MEFREDEGDEDHEGGSVLEVAGILFDRIQHVFPHGCKTVEEMQKARARVRREWKWYCNLNLDSHPYGNGKTELRAAF